MKILLLILLGVLTASPFLGAQGSRYPRIEITDVAAALYVTGWAVEKEIVIRPLALPEELRARLPESGPMTSAAREALKPQIVDFFSDVFTVRIDGGSAEFSSEGVKFIEPDTLNLVEISSAAAVPMEDFMIMVKYSAPLPRLDSTIAFRWNYFPEGLEKIPVRIADTLGTRLIEVSPASGLIDAEVRLASNLRTVPSPPPVPDMTSAKTPWLWVPVVAAPCALLLLFLKRWLWGIALGSLAAIVLFFTSHRKEPRPVSPEQAVEITDRILENVYHAFNIFDESAQYDQLQTVLDGAALEDTYLEVRRTTNQRSEEGSRVRVRDVAVKRAVPQHDSDARQLIISCQWETSGKIGHWGHFHHRTNRYSADILLAVIDGKWKATELNLNSRERE